MLFISDVRVCEIDLQLWLNESDAFVRIGRIFLECFHYRDVAFASVMRCYY